MRFLMNEKPKSIEKVRIPKRSALSYLKAIWQVGETKRQVKNKDIANHLNVTPATVTSMFKKLEKGGYIEYRSRRGAVLTEVGRHLAMNAELNEDALLRFLRFLGVEYSSARKDAWAIASVITPSTRKRLLPFVSSLNDSILLKDFFDRNRAQAPTTAPESIEGVGKVPEEEK